MSKIKYAIKNGVQCPILIWETKFGLVIHDRGVIDLQDGLEIYDVSTNKTVKNIDLMEFLFEALQFKENDNDEFEDEESREQILEQNRE